MYQDNAFKYVAILNRNTPPGRLLNVLAHGANALQRKLADDADQRFAHYVDRDGGEHGDFSAWPYIVLEASSSEKLRKARRQLLELGMPVVSFTAPMFGASNADQLRGVAAKSDAELEYCGIFVFGAALRLDPVLKKFSLFKSFRSEAIGTAGPGTAEGEGSPSRILLTPSPEPSLDRD